MECSHAKSCELFAQFALNPALKVWQIHYCNCEKHTVCARYQLSLQGQTVPLNLLPNGKMVEAPRDNSTYGGAALYNAILKDRTSMVESLLKNGVEINIKTADGTTPLMAAAARGNTDIINLLLSKGADVNAVNNAGETAFKVAMRYGFAPVAEMLKSSGAHPSSSVVTAAGINSLMDEALTLSTNAGAAVLPMPADRKPATPAIKTTMSSSTAYYLRITAKFDRTVSLKVIGVFRELGIDTEVVMQKKPSEGQEMSPIFVLTRPIMEQSLFRAIAKIEALGSGVGPVSCMRLEEMPHSDKVRRVS